MMAENAMDSDDRTVIVRCFKIVNRRGLHARASAKFVETVAAFDCQISVEKDGISVGGTSIMGLMMLAATPGCTIRIQAGGDQAIEAMQALETLIESRFGESC